MRVTIIEESGFHQAIMGIGLSYSLLPEEPCDAYELPERIWDRLVSRSYKLAGLGKGHDKFLRQVIMWVDIDAPLYWWKQFDQYKVATVTQSESTMHTLMKRPLVPEDFEGGIIDTWLNKLNTRIAIQDFDWVNRHLPQSFKQRRIVTMSYATVREIITQRTGHKLKEWKVFIDSMRMQACELQWLGLPLGGDGGTDE